MTEQKHRPCHSDTSDLSQQGQTKPFGTSDDALKLKQEQRDRAQRSQAVYAMQLKSPRY